MAILELNNVKLWDKDLFTKRKSIVASVQDTEDDKSFSRPGSSELFVEGKLIELKAMFSEMMNNWMLGHLP